MITIPFKQHSLTLNVFYQRGSANTYCAHTNVSVTILHSLYRRRERRDIVSPKPVAIISNYKQKTQGQTSPQYLKVAGLGTKLLKFHFPL